MNGGQRFCLNSSLGNTVMYYTPQILRSTALTRPAQLQRQVRPALYRSHVVLVFSCAFLVIKWYLGHERHFAGYIFFSGREIWFIFLNVKAIHFTPVYCINAIDLKPTKMYRRSVQCKGLIDSNAFDIETTKLM